MTILRARWVLPIDAPPIEKGAVAIDGERISAVGSADKLLGGEVEDLGDCALLPGFINAHTHLELTSYHGLLAPSPLWDWLLGLVALRRRPGTADTERQAVRDGAAQSLAAGVTCVGDISRTGLHVEMLRDSPIRKVCFLEIFSGSLQPPNDVPSLVDAAHRALALAEPDRLMIGLSPHALYSVTSSDLCKTARLARELDLPVTIHVLETLEERRWLQDSGGPLGELLARFNLPTAGQTAAGSAIERLERAGLLARGPLLAHVNTINDEELEQLARSRASVVWCPRAHHFFGHGPHCWRDMLAAGMNVCVGTDSLASNSSLSILDELRYLRALDRTTPPDLLLEMGTLRAARGLGLEDRLGSLLPGKLADLVAIPLNSQDSPDPQVDLLSGQSQPTGVWIAGHRAYPGPFRTKA